MLSEKMREDFVESNGFYMKCRMQSAECRMWDLERNIETIHEADNSSFCILHSAFDVKCRLNPS